MSTEVRVSGRAACLSAELGQRDGLAALLDAQVVEALGRRERRKSGEERCLAALYSEERGRGRVPS